MAKEKSSTFKRIMCLSISVFSMALIHSVSLAEPIIIDHNCTDISQITEHLINQAKAMFKISYGHTSHGSQIVTGMNLIKGAPGSLYWFDHNGTSGGLSFHDYEPSGDLGDPDRTTWAARTRDLLDRPDNDRNMIMWSWCGQADTTEENMQIYLDLMTQLENDYPDVSFIYMTGHLNGSGEEGQLNQRNNQVRTHCLEQGKNRILFDFADIESYNPDGSYFLDLGANDECYYWVDSVRYNWADEWCATNPGECESCSCAHSRCLNCQLKGRAFWWMMARLAGWSLVPVLDYISYDGCISELCTSAISVSAYDPEGGNLTYTWESLDGGEIMGEGADVQFDPSDNSLHPCPYRVELTITSDSSGLSTSETIDIYVKLAGDVDGNGVGNVLDKIQMRNHFGESGSPGWIDADVDCNGVVNVIDKVKVRNQFGQSGCACPQ